MLILSVSEMCLVKSLVNFAGGSVLATISFMLIPMTNTFDVLLLLVSEFFSLVYL